MVAAGTFDQMYRNRLDRKLVLERKRQPGITYPSHQQQSNVLVALFDLNCSSSLSDIKSGLKNLSGIFDKIYQCQREEPPDGKELSHAFLSSYAFSATLGFGKGFFDKLGIAESKVPPKLYGIPNNLDLNDPVDYTLNQTDLILQLASNNDFINRWVFYYSHVVPDYFLEYQSSLQPAKKNERFNETSVPDVVSTLEDWAILRDLHTGFQRLDGRNLMGFYDGISNPRGQELEDAVWINENDEDSRFRDGTYMVFQKFEHNLELWRMICTEEQEQMMGRSKATGLLLGTLQKEDDNKLAIDLHSKDRYRRFKAKRRLDKFMSLQRDPDYKVYDNINFSEINRETPLTSHVRLSNPRLSIGKSQYKIFRRGYLYSETGQAGNLTSGLLFISFQKDIRLAFEAIKKKLGKTYEDVPSEGTNRTVDERARTSRGETVETRNTIYRAKSGDHRFGANSESGQRKAGITAGINTGHLASITLGGGYYFVPPIPQRQIENIGEQFF